MRHLPAPDAKRQSPRDVIGALQRVNGYTELVTLLQFELAEARQIYEDQTASELNRGHIRGIASVLDLLTTGPKQ